MDAVGFCALFPELIERILYHVADPTSLRSVSRTCRGLAAATARDAPLWRALLAGRVDLTPRPGPATGWETEFFCFWDGSYGDPTDEVAFAPPLRRVRGLTDVDDHDGAGTFLYADNRARSAGGTNNGPAPAAGSEAGTPVAEDDAHSLYAAMAALTTAGAALRDPTIYDAYGSAFSLWWSESSTVPQVWAVRVAPTGLPWPPAGAVSGAAVSAATTNVDEAAEMAAARALHAAETAAAQALLAAAGATPPAAAYITDDLSEEAIGAASGQPAAALFRRAVSEYMAEKLVSVEPELGRPAPADVRARVAAANAAVEALLGDRPALLFCFGSDAMLPVGGVLAVRWSATLVVGLLAELLYS